MNRQELYPLLFDPVYKDYVWGGGRIAETYGRKPPFAVCAESWEIADRPEGMSVVANGPLAGRTLRTLVETLGPVLTGAACREGAFPLLIKLIDARERLSVQVHPDERAAAALGAEPKTEMWYVLRAEPEARVYAGLAPGTDRAAFAEALRAGRVESLLRSVPVEAGTAIHMPAGRVHAIGAGCLLLEIQQNSNTTYRVYDWGRTGHDGRPRELHVEQALESIRWDDAGRATVTPRRMPHMAPNASWEIVACPYFRVVRLDMARPESVSNDGRSFHALFVVSGRVVVEANGFGENLGAGVTCLLPAGVSTYRITPVTPRAVVIRAGVV